MNPTIHDLFSAAQWQFLSAMPGFDAVSVILHGMMDGSFPADGTGFVYGGLECSAVLGTWRSRVGPGVGFVYDSTNAEPMSRLAIGILHDEDNTSAVHDPADGAADRYDLVVGVLSIQTTNTEAVAQKTGPAENREIIRRSLLTPTVVTGVAGAGVPPAVPSGTIPLRIVLVPAAVGNLNTAVYTTNAIAAAAPTRRGNFSIKYYTDVDPIVLLQAHTKDEVYLGSYRWDAAEVYPAIHRTAGAGEYSGSMYPMLIPGARSYEVGGCILGGRDHYVTGTAADITVLPETAGGELSYARVASGNPGVVNTKIPIHVDVRGCELTGLRIVYEVTTAFDNLAVDPSVWLYCTDAAGVATAVKNFALINAVAGVIDSGIQAASTPVVVPPGGAVWAEVYVSVEAATTVGYMHVYSVQAQVTEGRA